MRWFRKLAPDPERDQEIEEARAAQARAHATIQQVHSQETEVVARMNALEQRRRQNNFGCALEVAMEGRR